MNAPDNKVLSMGMERQVLSLVLVIVQKLPEEPVYLQFDQVFAKRQGAQARSTDIP